MKYLKRTAQKGELKFVVFKRGNEYCVVNFILKNMLSVVLAYIYIAYLLTLAANFENRFIISGDYQHYKAIILYVNSNDECICFDLREVNK